MKKFNSFDQLSKAAYEYLNSQQQICEDKYLLSKHESWFYDQETGLITFSNFGKTYLEIKYEAVGTFSLKSNTWLWSWANPTTWPNTSSEILSVKDYGKEFHFDKLYNEKWEADIYDAWEMTAISAFVLHAKGAYRAPNNDEDIFSFKVFKEIKVLDEESLDDLRV
jgi:hypothetical protein